MDLTVLIATRNRAATLQTTLEAMTRVRRGNVPARFVVVDNGSTDHTSAVLETFRDQLPLTCLNEPRVGKSHALNHALDTASLGEIVVFTDDDITPDEHWLESIVDACNRWPKHDVFGGVIEPEWPNGWEPPPWARQELVQTLAFATHWNGESESEYPPGLDPFGGNFWIRRKALSGARWDGRTGVQPGSRNLGDETRFLLQFRRRGITPLYTPRARVRHRIAVSRTRKRAVYVRALQSGLGSVYLTGMPDKGLFDCSINLWRIQRLWSVVGRLCGLPAALFFPRDEVQRVHHTIGCLWQVAQEVQALRLSFGPDCASMDWMRAERPSTAVQRRSQHSLSNMSSNAGEQKVAVDQER